MLSHRNIVVGAESVSHYLETRADDVILAALPLSFDAGFSQLTTGVHASARTWCCRTTCCPATSSGCARGTASPG